MFRRPTKPARAGRRDCMLTPAVGTLQQADHASVFAAGHSSSPSSSGADRSEVVLVTGERVGMRPLERADTVRAMLRRRVRTEAVDAWSAGADCTMLLRTQGANCRIDRLRRLATLLGSLRLLRGSLLPADALPRCPLRKTVTLRHVILPFAAPQEPIIR